MELAEYQKHVSGLSTGKILHFAVYLHSSAIVQIPTALSRLVLGCQQNIGIGDDFNVIKFNKRDFRISFLSYPDFFSKAHPALMHAVTVDLGSGKVRRFSYENSTNRPILHRKEEMLPQGHERIEVFSKLTAAEERYGLYENTSIIGLQLAWERLLNEKGLRIRGHRISRRTQPAEGATSKTVEIKRHRTALTRQMLSKPVQLLVEHGQLSKGVAFFDFGCGQGDDLRILAKLGVTGNGWDPAFCPETPKRKADVVNLGFVLNVIEDPVERAEALLESFSLCESLLAVSVITPNDRDGTSWERCGDGVVTSRQTFQKYFTQAELRQYIEDVLDVPAIAMGLGIFFVFRDPAKRQEFMRNRMRRPINLEALSRRLYPKRRGGNAKLVYIENKALLDSFWETMLDMGRLPKTDEFEQTALLRVRVGSPRKAQGLFIELYGEKTLDAAIESRKDEWVVFLALANLRKRIPFSHFSRRQQRDIKTFFGDYRRARKQAEIFLYMIGDPDVIEEQCDEFSDGFHDEQALYIHRSLLGELPTVLRIYFGCAEALYGETHSSDIIKFHKRSGKLTLLEYDDFEGKKLPVLQWRTKIALGTQRIDVFDHRDGENGQLLYFKDRFVGVDHPQRKRWQEFSRKLSRLGIDTNGVLGPPEREFKELLAKRGLTASLRKKSTKPDN